MSICMTIFSSELNREKSSKNSTTTPISLLLVNGARKVAELFFAKTVKKETQFLCSKHFVFEYLWKERKQSTVPDQTYRKVTV